MGFTFTVTTGKGGRVEVFFVDGRLTDGRGQITFSPERFADVWAADLWLATDDFARFCGAFITAPYWREHLVESNV